MNPLIQQWALAAYKSKSPGEEADLSNCLDIITNLQPDQSNDPETLGITGAIYKRLWLMKQEREDIDKTIAYYRRGFELRQDYYCGENFATFLDYRAEIQTDPSEADFDRMTASRVRASIVAILTKAMDIESFGERPDRKWVFATLANCSIALGNLASGEHYEALFRNELPSDWEIETNEAAKAAVFDNK